MGSWYSKYKGKYVIELDCMTVILLDSGIWNEINVLTSNFILLGGNYHPKCSTAMQSPSSWSDFKIKDSLEICTFLAFFPDFAIWPLGKGSFEIKKKIVNFHNFCPDPPPKKKVVKGRKFMFFLWWPEKYLLYKEKKFPLKTLKYLEIFMKLTKILKIF